MTHLYSDVLERKGLLTVNFKKMFIIGENEGNEITIESKV